jgi:hypothetical protein
MNRCAVLGIAAGVIVWTAGAASASAVTIAVPAGGDLSVALLNARPGDTIALEPGATYVGNFTLPRTDPESTAVITLTTAGADTGGARGATRVTPTAAVSFAKLRSPNSDPTLSTAPGAHHWRISFLELQSAAGAARDLLELGSGLQRTLADVPHDLVVDHAYIHGDATNGQRRCVALNSAATTISNSYISECKFAGQEAQAIACWNGPGPFSIVNNYLEGAGETIMFGGGDPAIPGLVPSDIQIAGNLIAKPPSWRSEQWDVKNLLELKNARRVTIHHNVLQYNWQAAQVGFAVLFTVRNQDGGCDWCEVSDVTFEHNIVQHSAAGVSILGVDDEHPSRQTHGIVIRDNLFADIDNANWGGNGFAFLLIGRPRDVTIDHNTIIQEHASGLLNVDGPPVEGFVFTNNLGRQMAYGIIGTDHAPGNNTIAWFFPGARIVGNVIADADASRYPSGNRFPTSEAFRSEFRGYAAGDYRLVPSTTWLGTDNRAVGADFAALPPQRRP